MFFSRFLVFFLYFVFSCFSFCFFFVFLVFCSFFLFVFLLVFFFRSKTEPELALPSVSGPRPPKGGEALPRGPERVLEGPDASCLPLAPPNGGPLFCHVVLGGCIVPPRGVSGGAPPFPPSARGENPTRLRGGKSPILIMQIDFFPRHSHRIGCVAMEMKLHLPLPWEPSISPLPWERGIAVILASYSLVSLHFALMGFAKRMRDPLQLRDARV